MNSPTGRPGPSLDSVRAARERIAGRVRRTPTLVLGQEDTGLPGRVVLKLELLQHTGSFKARGALNSVLSLPQDAAGVCAASGGNHGAAVAWAAGQTGLKADVFVPETSTPAKLQRIEEYGAALHPVNGDVGAALDACLEFADAHDLPLIHPYDTVETVSGAGTLGLEVESQVPDVDVVVLGCGGGGLYAGVATALEGTALVQPVETEGCDHLAAALAAGTRVPRPSEGVAADALGPPRIGELAFATATRLGSSSVLVDDASVLAARRFLWDRVRVLAEPAACVALAAVLTGRVEPQPGSTTVVVVSGGNNATLPPR